MVGVVQGVDEGAMKQTQELSLADITLYRVAAERECRKAASRLVLKPEEAEDRWSAFSFHIGEARRLLKKAGGLGAALAN
jgi:hypothetical protein